MGTTGDMSGIDGWHQEGCLDCGQEASVCFYWDGIQYSGLRDRIVFMYCFESEHRLPTTEHYIFYKPNGGWLFNFESGHGQGLTWTEEIIRTIHQHVLALEL